MAELVWDRKLVDLDTRFGVCFLDFSKSVSSFDLPLFLVPSLVNFRGAASVSHHSVGWSSRTSGAKFYKLEKNNVAKI